MFFFGLSALCFGLAFFGPIKVFPPPPKGLVPLSQIVPLEVWGVAWLLVAAYLIWSSCRQDQSKAMGAYAAMLFVSAASYTTAGALEFATTGFTALWFAAAIYGSILGACVGVARLVNAPPIDVEALLAGLRREETAGDHN